jgi:hypothetical protein
LKVGECREVLRADKVVPCGAEVRRFMVIYQVNEVKAMFYGWWYSVVKTVENLCRNRERRGLVYVF